MSLPGQSFTHMLNPLKGWPSMTALDYAAKISSNVLYDMQAGQAAHLNDAGELEPGIELNQMGLWTFQGKNSFDVNRDRNDFWTPLSPSGNVMCLVAEGGFELESSEFDDTQVYAYNDLLRSPVGNAEVDYADNVSGQLTNDDIDLYVKVVCAVVSRVPYTNSNGKRVIGFWPTYLPGTDPG